MYIKFNIFNYIFNICNVYKYMLCINICINIHINYINKIYFKIIYKS